MKKVFTNSYDVIHLFAQRSQEEANCSNVFFEGNRIWSYGRHYLLAEFIKNKQGQEAILINNEGYSVTTSKHISEVRQATRQYKQFFVMQINPAKVLYQLKDLADRLVKAKKPELYISQAEILFQYFNEFQMWNGKTNDRVSLKEINKVIKLFRNPDYLHNYAEKIKKAEKIRANRIKQQFQLTLKNFFEYKTDYLHSEEDYVRISEDKEFIETSQRVRVPIREAKVLYKLIKAKKDIKGFQISGYTVIGLNGVLKIGCHKINIANMTEIGEQIIK
jgi:hypothetical protein